VRSDARAAQDLRNGHQPAAILFDFGGTLDADALPWKERMFRICRAEGLVVPPERFDPLFYGADDALVGAIPATLSLEETVRRLVTDLGSALGLSNGRLVDRLLRRFLEDATRSVRGNVSLLSDLARRYPLGLVSNFYGNLSAVCDDLGIRSLFRVIVDSEAVGCTKPDPRIFRHALDALGVAAGDATFVGDSPSRDMAGARGVGMAHIWLVGEASHPPPCCPGDRVIRSLGELRGLFL
jgi:putative hydrolase of the HAD superfamily